MLLLLLHKYTVHTLRVRDTESFAVVSHVVPPAGRKRNKVDVVK